MEAAIERGPINLRHALILAINTSILAVLFAFTAWLYLSERSEVENQVASNLERAAAVTEELAKLRERELSSLAVSIAVSPLLRGALATEDADTIEDVLKTIAGKNSLPVAAVVRGERVKYSSRPDARGKTLEELARGRFSGSAQCSETAVLILAEEPSPALFDSWSAITGVRYALLSRGPSPAHNVPEEDQALLGRRLEPGAPEVLTAGSKYYARQARILEGRFTLGLYDLYAPFWKGFEARRNSLAVLGSLLFFFGLILSLVFSRIIEAYARPGAEGSGDWQRLLAEIEAARDAKA